MIQHTLVLLTGFIVGFFSLVVAVIAFIEHGVRDLLARIGIGGQIQTALLALLLLGLIVVAIRLFGRFFGMLIAVLLLLVLLHALFVFSGGSVSLRRDSL